MQLKLNRMLKDDVINLSQKILVEQFTLNKGFEDTIPPLSTTNSLQFKESLSTITNKIKWRITDFITPQPPISMLECLEHNSALSNTIKNTDFGGRGCLSRQGP